jgi:hypothetical protein
MRVFDFLPEVKMAPSTVKAAVQNLHNVLVGIEYELVVPNQFVEEVDDVDATSIDQIVDFFDLDRGANSPFSSQRFAEKLSDEYLEYVSEETRTRMTDTHILSFALQSYYWKDSKDEYIETVRTSYPDVTSKEEILRYAKSMFEDDLDIPNNDQLRNEAIYDAVHNNLFDIDENDWLLNTDIATMDDVADRYGLNWPQPRLNSSVTECWSKLAKDLSNALGKAVFYSDKYQTFPRSTARDRGGYIIEPDSSIDDNSGRGTGIDYEYIGVEIISPPLPIDELFRDFKAIKKWAEEMNCFTNSSTGLHINVSVDGGKSQIDFIKLALFLGDNYVLKAFNRLANKYCRSTINLLNQAAVNLTQDTVTGMIHALRKGLNSSASEMLHSVFRQLSNRYVSINLHANAGYVEFRAPGGNWLDIPIDYLESTTQRFAYALSLACDPTAAQTDYYKKFYALLAPLRVDQNQDSVELFTYYNAGLLSKEKLVSTLKSRIAARKNKPLVPTPELEDRNRDVIRLSLDVSRQHLTMGGAGDLLLKFAAVCDDVDWTKLLRQMRLFLLIDPERDLRNQQRVFVELYKEARYWFRHITSEHNINSMPVSEFVSRLAPLERYYNDHLDLDWNNPQI